MKTILYIATFVIMSNLLFSKSKFFSVNLDTQELCLISEDGRLEVLTKLDFIDENRVVLEYQESRNSLLILKSNGDLYSYNLNTLETTKLFSLYNNQFVIEGSWTGITINNRNEIFVYNEIGGPAAGRLFKLIDNNTGFVAPYTDNNSGSPSILGIEYDDENRIWNIEQCCRHTLGVLDGFRGELKQIFKNPVSINFPQDLAYNPDTKVLMGVDIKNEYTADRTDFFTADRNNGTTEIFLSLDGHYNGIAELTTASSVNSELDLRDKFKVYPNPTQKMVSVDYEGLVNDIRIYDLNGNVVLNNIYSIKNIDISNLSSGTYVLSFKIDNRVYDRVFIKN